MPWAGDLFDLPWGVVRRISAEERVTLIVAKAVRYVSAVVM